MANPLKGAFGNNNTILQRFRNDFASFQKNPTQFLMQKKLNIPQEYQNNPEQMVQYLLNSGQMSQETFNNYNQFVNQLRNINASN